MGLPKRLTEMQKRFAELLVFGGPDGPLSKSELLSWQDTHLKDHVLKAVNLQTQDTHHWWCNTSVNCTTNDYKNMK